MYKSALIVSGILVLMLSSVVSAQDTEEKDFMEVAVFGGLSNPIGGINKWGSDSLAAKSGWNAGLDVGFFMTPSLVLGLNFAYNQYSIDNPNEPSQMHHRLYNPAIYAKYYFFSESRFAPYIKGQAGFDNPKFATLVLDGAQYKYRELSYKPAFAIGGGGGLFVYTSDASGFFVEANVHHAFSTDVVGTYQSQEYKFGKASTLIDVHAGLAALFGSGK
ncbi:MAG: outer membrane beta-barrel protein [candidate division Zixibacteria bacterium]|nr:outer membrane beta-barrel protein [candidate division Zixibacteria bacterium]